MESFKDSWEKKYHENDHLWGEDADEPLVRYSCLFSKGSRILDLGCGDGRNLLYFARKGFDVHGIDFSENAVLKCREKSIQENLSVTATSMDIRDYTFKKESWDVIIAPMVLHAMKVSESSKIIKSMKLSTKPKGFIFISVLAVGDSHYHERKESCEEIESDTFHVTDKNFNIHYFNHKELNTFFKTWKLIYSARAMSLRLGERWNKAPLQSSLYFMGQKV